MRREPALWVYKEKGPQLCRQCWHCSQMYKSRAVWQDGRAVMKQLLEEINAGWFPSPPPPPKAPFLGQRCRSVAAAHTAALGEAQGRRSACLAQPWFIAAREIQQRCKPCTSPLVSTNVPEGRHKWSAVGDGESKAG